MNEAKKHVRPGVSWDGPLGVVGHRSGPVYAEPVGTVRCFHGRDGSRRESGLGVCRRSIKPAANVLHCVRRDAFG
eukprot:6811412-Alexandrium_andersonii.AAC.1